MTKIVNQYLGFSFHQKIKMQQSGNSFDMI